MATNFQTRGRVEEPIEDVWRVIKTPESDTNVGFGIEEISFSPEDQGLVGGVEVSIKIGAAAMKGLRALGDFRGEIVFLVEEVNDEKYYLQGSVVEAPKGITGEAVISLSRDPQNKQEVTYLHFKGEFESVPLKLRLGLAAVKGLIDSKLMPWVGQKIAKKSSRLRREVESELD